HRGQVEELPGAVEAHRLPATVELDGAEDALPLLRAGDALGAHPDRTGIDPARVAAPAAAAAKLADARAADVAGKQALAHPTVLRQRLCGDKFSATFGGLCRRHARSSTLRGRPPRCRPGCAVHSCFTSSTSRS